MARPGQRGGDTATVENPTTTPTEAPNGSATVVPDGEAQTAVQTDAQPTTTESGEQATATPAPQQATKPEKSDDTTALKAMLAEIYAPIQSENDTVSDADVQRVVAEYRTLGSKGRAEARKTLNEDMRKYLQDREVPKAQAAVKLSDAIQQGGAAGGSKAAKAPAEPVDPTEAFVKRAYSYDLAKRLVVENVPENVADDWAAQAAKMREDLADQVKAYQEWLTARANVAEGQEAPAKPEGIDPAVEIGFRLAQGRAAGSGKKASSPKVPHDGPRRSVKEHILQAFDSHPVGSFLKVSEIQGYQSTVYGTESPSSGAVSSALKSPNLPDSLEAGHKDGHFGAYKRAERARS